MLNVVYIMFLYPCQLEFGRRLDRVSSRSLKLDFYPGQLVYSSYLF